MAPTASAAGIRSVVLLAGLLALSAPSTDAQNTTVNSTNNSDSNDRPVCPVQGENYCVCAAGSCSSCVECAGCKDWQCIAPPARWTGPQSSRAAGEFDSHAITYLQQCHQYLLAVWREVS